MTAHHLRRVGDKHQTNPEPRRFASTFCAVVLSRFAVTSSHSSSFGWLYRARASTRRCISPAEKRYFPAAAPFRIRAADAQPRGQSPPRQAAITRSLSGALSKQERLSRMEPVKRISSACTMRICWRKEERSHSVIGIALIRKLPDVESNIRRSDAAAWFSRSRSGRQSPPLRPASASC